MSEDNTNIIGKEENPYFGLILAFIILFFGSFLFLGSNMFGPEMLMKILGMFFVLSGIIAFGVEFTTKIKNDGALELAFGLGLSLLILMLRNTFEGFPNILTLIIGTLAFFCVLMSLSNFIPQYKSGDLFEKSTVQGGIKIFYKWLLIIGEISGAVVSIYNLAELFLSK